MRMEYEFVNHGPLLTLEQGPNFSFSSAEAAIHAEAPIHIAKVWRADKATSVRPIKYSTSDVSFS